MIIRTGTAGPTIEADAVVGGTLYGYGSAASGAIDYKEITLRVIGRAASTGSKWGNTAEYPAVTTGTVADSRLPSLAAGNPTSHGICGFFGLTSAGTAAVVKIKRIRVWTSTLGSGRAV